MSYQCGPPKWFLWFKNKIILFENEKFVIVSALMFIVPTWGKCSMAPDANRLKIIFYIIHCWTIFIFGFTFVIDI